MNIKDADKVTIKKPYVKFEQQGRLLIGSIDGHELVVVTEDLFMYGTDRCKKLSGACAVNFKYKYSLMINAYKHIAAMLSMSDNKEELLPTYKKYFNFPK